MLDALQALLGLLVLMAFWWGVFAVIRLFEPTGVSATRRGVMDRGRDAGAGSAPARGTGLPSARDVNSIGAEGDRCCPACAPGCQVTGLAMGQAWGQGDAWWGRPFDEEGANTEAMAFWGDDCCPNCADCPICQRA